MKVILLLGTNFVRSQLLLLAIVLAYVICLTSFLAFHEQLPDLLFFIRQQAIYAIALGAMVVVPAIQNERKSRRVLNVLSKGIHRWQYLGGLLCGSMLISAMFCMAVGLSAMWLARRAAMPVSGLAELMLILFLASVAAASTALFCSTFLHPFLALPATAALVFLPFAAEADGWHLAGNLFPVFVAMRLVLGFSFHSPLSGLWATGIAALVHTSLFWLAASLVFARRDITVASE